MPKIIFTPWKDITGLVAVRSQFYPSSHHKLDLRANACRTVEAWKLRGNLPHPVEATALLTDAILHDDAAKNSIFSIRATYSAAFCRFVTTLVDSKLHGQRKTMFQRAVDLGLPASFVELRHEATHRELPSLVVLRSAAQRSLEWLWDFYWAKIDLPTAETSRSTMKPIAAEEFIAIRAETEQILKQIRQTEDVEPPRKRLKAAHTRSFISQPLIAICRNQVQGSLIVARTLLEDGMLISKERQIEQPSDSTFSRWAPLLESLSESHPSFLNVLAEEMVNEIGTPSDTDVENDLYRESIYMWLVHILSAKTWETHRKCLSFSYLRAACEDNPNHWTKLLRSRLEDTYVQIDVPRASNTSRDIGSTDDAEKTASSLEADSWEELKEFGWQSLGSWTSRPFGVA